MQQFDVPSDGDASDDEIAAARAAIQAELLEQQKITHGHAMALQSISQQIGKTVGPDPYGLVMLRLNTLIEMLLSDDARAQFELEFERRLAPQLAALVAQARKLSLTAPLQTGGNGLPPSLIVPGH